MRSCDTPSSTRKAPPRPSPARGSEELTLAIVKRASFPATSRFQPRPGEANIAAGGRATDIDLEAFLNAGRRNSRRQALLRPIGVVLDTPGLNGLKAIGASDEEDPKASKTIRANKRKAKLKAKHRRQRARATA